MQAPSSRRSNRDRTEATRADLIAAGRRLFREKGYAATGTPEIVAAAGVTRGALYHHFADKQALFRAVVEAEAKEVADEINTAAPAGLDPLGGLAAGSKAYLAAMQAPGRTRLLLLDGPSVLGRAEMEAIDNQNGAGALREGLRAAIDAKILRDLPVDALTSLLSAMFDRAALDIEAGRDFDDGLAAMLGLIDGLRR